LEHVKVLQVLASAEGGDFQFFILEQYATLRPIAKMGCTAFIG
jgi:hypothetical protein